MIYPLEHSQFAMETGHRTSCWGHMSPEMEKMGTCLNQPWYPLSSGKLTVCRGKWLEISDLFHCFNGDFP